MNEINHGIVKRKQSAADESTGLISRKEETAPTSTPAGIERVIAATFLLLLGLCVALIVPSPNFISQTSAGEKLSISTRTPSRRYHEFPESFVWGAATSSYQIEGAVHEGGRGVSIWDTYCAEDDKIIDGSNGGVACDHYHRMEEDVRLMKELGLKAYRFSIAWPRILPNGKVGDDDESGLNQEGIDFYNQLIDELLKNDIEPWVTLYHWDLPQALEDEYGGWLSPRIVDDFGRYASVCFKIYGDRVKRWITINESWTQAVQAYGDGTKAPGKIANPDVEVYLVAHHLLLAHARAVRRYRALDQGGTIGISNCGDFRYPLDPKSLQDQDAAERSMVFQYAWLTDPLVFGDYPSQMRDRLGERLPQFIEAQKAEMIGSLDFMGLNHYSTLYASAKTEKSIFGGYWADMDVEFSSDPSWRKNFMVSNIVYIVST